MRQGRRDAPESLCRFAGLHRELSRRSTMKDGVYFLSHRAAANACDGLSHQEAHTITLAMARVGVIKIESKGKVGLNGKKAAEFRYLLQDDENGMEDEGGGFDY